MRPFPPPLLARRDCAPLDVGGQLKRAFALRVMSHPVPYGHVRVRQRAAQAADVSDRHETVTLPPQSPHRTIVGDTPAKVRARRTPCCGDRAVGRQGARADAGGVTLQTPEQILIWSVAVGDTAA